MGDGENKGSGGGAAEGVDQKPKIVRQTDNFLWNVKANLVVLIVALGILIYCLAMNRDVHGFIICLFPLELLIAYFKITSIMSRKDLPSRKHKIIRVCTSSQVLDALSISLSSLIFFSVKYVSSFKYTFCLGPILLATTIILFKAIFTKKDVSFQIIARMKAKPSELSFLQFLEYSLCCNLAISYLRWTAGLTLAGKKLTGHSGYFSAF